MFVARQTLFQHAVEGVAFGIGIVAVVGLTGHPVKQSIAIGAKTSGCRVLAGL